MLPLHLLAVIDRVSRNSPDWVITTTQACPTFIYAKSGFAPSFWKEPQSSHRVELTTGDHKIKGDIQDEFAINSNKKHKKCRRRIRIELLLKEAYFPYEEEI
ncbi:hypothetical protein Mic7113_0253 [Allocoleopsis franciscana PCC 7113]|uniref:Uncharacterized protein n=1 Tax=Allocoleopsis franciscana PCC 7113 TaxID=1173027 RepID=K9W7J6_9CYAN|nr:hypothetical protein Mic7113_0253 [Allocoleopsis franciscana PCC 7113]